MNQNYIGFSNIKPGYIIKSKKTVVFHKYPNLLSLGRQFPTDTCFTILEVSKNIIHNEHITKIITVLYDNELWYKSIDICLYLMFEVML